MDKLSELSKPAWIVGEQEIADFMRGEEALLVRGHDPESTEPALRMYSQEYVSALLAELEAKDREIDAANARVDVMCAKAMNLTERAESAEKRLATPVRLPKPCAFNLCDLVDRDAVIASLREQGFTVEGDE